MTVYYQPIGIIDYQLSKVIPEKLKPALPIVVELKATPFKPEYAGQLNFYINVVDDKLRGENDNKTIGLLLCKGKDEVVAQYALTGYDQPIGISDYQLSKVIPEKLKSALPSVEEVEEELASFLDKDNNTQK